MKEMTIEQKARAYDEALERAKNEYQTHKSFNGFREMLVRIFPSLKENNDEEIRKALINVFATHKDYEMFFGVSVKDIHAWLERQGSQDNDEDVDILNRFSFYAYKDEPNILYLSGLYVNEEYRNKGIGTKILEIADEVANNLDCHAIRLKTKKDSNAERLYRTHGYNSLSTEERDWIWLEKQDKRHIACSEEQMDEFENEYLKSIPKY